MQNVSRALGKDPTWCRNTSRPGRSPALATVADVADVLGYDVAVVDRATGDVVAVVDPPRRARRG